MKEVNSAEGSEEVETEQQRLVSQYSNLKMKSEPHQLAEESQEEKFNQQQVTSNLRIMSVDPNFTCARGGRKKPEFIRSWTPPLPAFIFKIEVLT